MNNTKDTVTEANNKAINNKKKKVKAETVIEIDKIQKDKIYALYLAIPHYKSLLNDNEYILKDNGEVLLGLYKDKNLALQHKDKFSKRGLLVNLITE